MGKHTGKRHMYPIEMIDGFIVRNLRPEYWQVDFQRGGRRVRQGFNSIEEVKTFCQIKRTEITNRGLLALDFSTAARDDAIRAIEILTGTGASLVQAAEEYVKRHPRAESETFRQTCDKYLACMQREGRRPASIKDKQVKLNRLCTALGACPSASIDKLDLRQWADAADLTAGTAHAYIGAANSVLAMFRGERRERLRHADEKPPATWTVATVKALFHVAEREVPDAVPALAVLFFAGIRPTEMMRLTWNEIDLGAGLIRLTGEVTKTRHLRNVEIRPNLSKWLLAHRPADGGPLVKSPASWRVAREKLMRSAKIAAWPVDVPRHTYATMLLATTHDAAHVANELGHFSSTETFVRFYKGVPVAVADAVAFWKIRPMKSSMEFKARNQALA